jgi:hypothetical protein
MLSTVVTVQLVANVLVLGYCLYKIANLRRYVQQNNKRALSLRKMAEVETTLTELSDAYDALLASHKKLRSRISMRQRRAKDETDDMPDPKTDPAGWKRAMRLKLRNQGVL